jgi:hypothetical protein
LETTQVGDANRRRRIDAASTDARTDTSTATRQARVHELKEFRLRSAGSDRTAVGTDAARVRFRVRERRLKSERKRQDGEFSGPTPRTHDDLQREL